MALAALAVALLPLASCGDKEKLETAQTENTALNTQLQQTLATQDSLFVLINEITDGMTQIKEIERIVATPGTLMSESPSRKEQLRSDMAALQAALKERRERLEELEGKLKEHSSKNATLLKTIDNLKAQIAEQQTEIRTLTNQLAEAGVKITQLGTQVDSLTSVVVQTTEAIDQVSEENATLDSELNACYFVVGSQSELKDNKIIETGFLRKTKVLPSDFNTSYFTRADKRTLTEIPTHSKKAEVMSNQPKDSYTIVDDGTGQKVVRITNPTEFWKVSNYLVVKVD